jgi:hypothetical protein
MFLLLLLESSLLEMILLLFLPQHLNLFTLMDVNIICRSIWLKPFKIWPLYLLKVEVEVMLMLIFLQILQ